MKSPHPSRLARISNEGFTLVETIVAAGLLAVVGVTAISAFYKVLDMQRVADRWTDSDQARSLVTAALADSSKCANNIVAAGAAFPAAPITTATTALDIYEYDSGPGTTRPVLLSNQLGPLSNGVTYLIQFTTPPTPTVIPAGAGRPLAASRYIASLNLTAKIQGFGDSNVAQIPILMEFDTSNNLTRCTLNPDDTDEALKPVAGVVMHTASDCYAIGGQPFPTDAGLICRVPEMDVHADGVTVPTCPAGWTQLAGYSSTITRDYVYDKCGSPSTATEWEGYHPFSSANGGAIESRIIQIKSGTGSSFSWQAFGGATGGGVILFGVLGAVLGPFSLLAIGFGFIFAATSCTTQNQTVYAQALAIGCY